MAVSILGALENAKYNLNSLTKFPMLLPLVEAQLHNAITLLEKGYPVDTLIEPLLELHGDVETVPYHYYYVLTK